MPEITIEENGLGGTNKPKQTFICHVKWGFTF